MISSSFLFPPNQEKDSNFFISIQLINVRLHRPNIVSCYNPLVCSTCHSYLEQEKGFCPICQPQTCLDYKPYSRFSFFQSRVSNLDSFNSDSPSRFLFIIDLNISDSEFNLLPEFFLKLQLDIPISIAFLGTDLIFFSLDKENNSFEFSLGPPYFKDNHNLPPIPQNIDDLRSIFSYVRSYFFPSSDKTQALTSFIQFLKMYCENPNDISNQEDLSIDSSSNSIFSNDTFPFKNKSGENSPTIDKKANSFLIQSLILFGCGEMPSKLVYNASQRFYLFEISELPSRSFVELASRSKVAYYHHQHLDNQLKDELEHLLNPSSNYPRISITSSAGLVFGDFYGPIRSFSSIPLKKNGNEATFYHVDAIIDEMNETIPLISCGYCSDLLKSFSKLTCFSTQVVFDLGPAGAFVYNSGWNKAKSMKEWVKSIDFTLLISVYLQGKAYELSKNKNIHLHLPWIVKIHRLKLPSSLGYVNSRINNVLTFWENLIIKEPLPEGVKLESILTMFYNGSEAQSFVSTLNQKSVDILYFPPNIIVSEDNENEVKPYLKAKNIIKIPAADFAKLISTSNQFHTEYQRICSC